MNYPVPRHRVSDDVLRTLIYLENLSVFKLSLSRYPAASRREIRCIIAKSLKISQKLILLTAVDKGIRYLII